MFTNPIKRSVPTRAALVLRVTERFIRSATQAEFAVGVPEHAELAIVRLNRKNTPTIAPLDVRIKSAAIRTALDAAAEYGINTVFLSNGIGTFSLGGGFHLIDAGNLVGDKVRLDPVNFSLTTNWEGEPIRLWSLLPWIGEMTSDSAAAWRAEMPHIGSSLTPKAWIDSINPYAIAVAQILRLVLGYDLGGLSPTPAAQALAAWRHRIGPRSSVAEARHCTGDAGSATKWRDIVLPIATSRLPVRQAARRSLIGPHPRQFFDGRTPGKVFVWDASSYYCRLLRTAILPYRADQSVSLRTVEQLTAASEKRFVAACVYIHSEERQYPFRAGKGIVWGRGSGWLWLCGEELRSALAAGHVERVWRAYAWHQTRLASDWSDEILSMRADLVARNEQGSEQVAKRIGNSLWGKFAQRGRHWQHWPERPAPFRWGTWQIYDKETGKSAFCRSVAGRVEVLKEGVDPSFSTPEFGAALCSYGREVMRRLMDLLPENCVYYTHTDSLHVNSEAHKLLLAMSEQPSSLPIELRLQHEWDHATYLRAGAFTWSVGDKTGHSVTGVAREADVDEDGTADYWIPEPWNVWGGEVPPSGTRYRRQRVPIHRRVRGTRQRFGEWIEPLELSAPLHGAESGEDSTIDPSLEVIT